MYVFTISFFVINVTYLWLKRNRGTHRGAHRAFINDVTSPTSGFLWTKGIPGSSVPQKQKISFWCGCTQKRRYAFVPLENNYVAKRDGRVSSEEAENSFRTGFRKTFESESFSG